MDKKTERKGSGANGLMRNGEGKDEKPSALLRAGVALVATAAMMSTPRLSRADVSIDDSNNVNPASIFQASIGGIYEGPIFKDIGNVPLPVRNVPIFPTDGGTPGPLPNQSLQFDSGNVDFLKLSIGIPFEIGEKSFVRFGIGTDILFPINSDKDQPGGSDIVERNYLNAPGTSQRGYGAALTYMSGETNYWGINNDNYIRPFVFLEGGTKISDSVSLIVGCDAYQENVYINTGWDRYDSLQTFANYKLGSFYVTEPYLTLRLDYLSAGSLRADIDLSVGESNVIGESKTGIGRQTSLTYKPAIDAGITLNVRF